jgi:hypothetical protein
MSYILVTIITHPGRKMRQRGQPHCRKFGVSFFSFSSTLDLVDLIDEMRDISAGTSSTSTRRDEKRRQTSKCRQMLQFSFFGGGMTTP